MSRTVPLALALSLSVTLVAGVARSAPPAGEVVVFEAASLRDAFAALAARFEREHPGARVVTNAAGSQELRAQIEQGAAADVFASADERQMNALVAAGLAGTPALFACNEPVIVVRRELAGGIETFADLPRAARIVVGASEVPIGAYTAEIWRRAAAAPAYGPAFVARVEAKIVSRETNVRQVLAKIVLGEADAGVVYRSDARAAQGKVAVVEIPPALEVTASYPIAVLAGAPHAALARAFVDLVRAPAGVAALREAGFVPCTRR
ncbi:MAG TPA: molybdate ABC transporter substrate-binding protein [Polyangia bacterium]|nr:molybdate ABC transporter substrate-binding protein [Polyangia bacterium]